MIKRLLAIGATVSLLLPLGAAAAGTPSDKFVRTANYFLLSGKTLEDPAVIDVLTKSDLLVLPAEAQIFNRPFFEEARRRNPDILILAYVPSVSYNNLYWSDALHLQLRKGIEEGWWLRGPDGNVQNIWPSTSALNLNSGWTDYLAGFVASNVLSTGLWDGVFYDEVSDSISWVGPVDTNRDGAADEAGVADTNWRNGYANLFSQTRAKVGPDTIIITNGSSNDAFQPYVNGRMFESFPTPWEADGSWATVMSRYLGLENKVGYDPVFILNGNTNNTGNRTDYRQVRFGIGSTLLGSGYFSFDHGTESHNQTWVYDEYNAYLGEPKGQPEDLLKGNQTISAVHVQPQIRDSVWGRDFVNGKVLVNATASTQTVRLDGEYEKLHGSQDPTVNNGAIVSRVTLDPKDGLVLLRPIESIQNAVFLNGAFTRIFDGSSGKAKRTGFFAYESAYHGGQRVVHEDLNGDGTLETVVANDTAVFIYADTGALSATFEPYGPAYKSGINIAVGDLENDGTIEIVTGTKNGGGPQIRIFNKNGVLIHPGFFAYDTGFRGGVSVAIGDLNGDNVNEIIAGAGSGGGPHVRVFNKDGKVINPGFFAYDEKFRGGVRVAAGDVDGDGKDEIITGPGNGGGPHVKIFQKDGKLVRDFFAFETTDNRGVDVSAADVDSDGKDEILGQSAEVFTFSLF
ncbi:VCBS repeat-containing protein [Candidatus Uhrbacteria bacterium]|nr:VCBS repeat-containing protein [Candidatus Uhrbacteria bacterium]